MTTSQAAATSELDLVHYELDMLFFTAAEIAQRGAGMSQAERNVYIESFCVHTRNLLEFFRVNTGPKPLKPPKSNSIVAGRFFSGWSDRVAPPELTNAYVELCTNVTHLSTGRLALLGKNWPIIELTNYIDDQRREFEKGVNAATQSVRWSKKPLKSPFQRGPIGAPTPPQQQPCSATGPAGPTTKQHARCACQSPTSQEWRIFAEGWQVSDKLWLTAV